LLKVNELGMVPTIVDVDTGCVITESINCIQYIDEVVRERSNDSSSSSSSSSSSEKKKMDYILAETANERQKERVYADIMAKTVCSKYYTVLVRQDEREQLEAFDEILKGIEKFAANLVHDVEGKTGKGPFFNGRDTPGLVDYTLFPWAWRLPVFEHYRDSRFKIDQSKSVGLFKYTVWLAEMCKRDDVKRTLPNWDEYLEHIGRYADGSARSKVANAVRDGRNAHDYEKDKM
jgi:glutathione S-transferase